MKKLILASAIAALSVSAAHAAPTVYGKVAVATSYTDDNNDDNDMHIDNDGTRFGLKGSEAITDAGTSVTYKLEYGLNLDVKGADAVTQRDSFIGLKNDAWGEVRFGNQGSVDAISNEPSSFGGLEGEADARLENNLVFIAPSMNGFDMSASLVLEGDKDISLAATYAPDNAPFTLGASYSNHSTDSEVTLAASYKIMPALTAMIDYQMTDDGSDDMLNSMDIAGVYSLNDKQEIYAQFDMFDQGSADGTSFSAGSNYSFTDSASGGAYFGYDTDAEEMEIGASFEYNF